MDLTGLALAAPDVRGYVKVLGVRKSAYDAGTAPDLNLLRLIPGAKLAHGSIYLPCNVLALTAAASTRPPIPPGRLQLREYQLEAVQFIENTPRGCMVCLDVGLGKTPITLEFLRRHPELRPFVVVGPLIASGAWVGENADPFKYFDMKVVALHTRKPEEVEPADGYFVNFQILAPYRETTKEHQARQRAHDEQRLAEGKLLEPLDRKSFASWLPYVTLKINPKVVIADECHEVRNFRNTYAKAVHKLCQYNSVAKRVFLSATPVVNKVADLYYQLDSVQPGLWGHYVPYNQNIITSFGTRYCAGNQDNGYGWDCSGESNTAELKQRLANVMIRQSRFDVRKELPPFERQRLDVPANSLDRIAFDEYQSIANATSEAARLAGSGVLQGHELQRLTGMFKVLSWAKRDVAAKQAATMARSAETRKVLVYTWFKQTASYIVKALKKQKLHVYGPITGESTIAKRNKDAEAFRDLVLEPNGAAVLVATLGSASQSLNPLSAASSTLFVDLWYVPQILLQAEGRTHREGQTAARVLALYLCVAGTIDEIMFDHLSRKAKYIAHVTGDETATSLCETLGGRSEAESLQALVKAMAGLDVTALGLT